MKVSFIHTDLMLFQSVTCSPSKIHTDSKDILMTAVGLFIDLTSTKCCFLIDFTAF